MQLPLALTCLLTVVCATSVFGRDPAARIDASKRSSIKTGESTITPEVQQFDRVDGVQNKRFDTGTLREEPRSSLGDKRAAIDLKESKKKNLITPEKKTYEKITYDNSAFDGKRSNRFQTGEQTYRTSLSERYQSSLSDAADAAPKTVVKKRTTFDSVNRFIFRRNRPEGDDLITPAGSAPADSQP